MDRNQFIKRCKAEGVSGKRRRIGTTLFELCGNAGWSISKAQEPFTDEQVEQAAYGFRCRLTLQQVDYYFKPEFPPDKMFMMRTALVSGLDTNDLDEICRDGFSAEQVEVGCAYRDSVADEFFEEIYQKCFSAGQMKLLFYSVQCGMVASLEELKVVAKSEYSLERMEAAIAAVHKVGAEKVKLFQNPCLGKDVIDAIVYAVMHGAGDGFIKVADSGEYGWEQVIELYYGEGHGLTAEQIGLYADPVYSADEMKARRLALEQGAAEADLKQYFSPMFSNSQKELIIRAFLEGLSLEEVHLVADYCFTPEQMEQALYGFVGGLTLEQVRRYYKAEHSALLMRNIRICMENVIADNCMDFLLA